MFSTRTVLSLCQYLSQLGGPSLGILIEKHGIQQSSGPTLQGIRFSLAQATNDQIISLATEIIATEAAISDEVVRYPYDNAKGYRQRWDDLIQCLLLDGYTIASDRLIPVDPAIQGAVAVEDELSSELNESGLQNATEILRLIRLSNEAFLRTPPDYNAALTNVRAALQTLVTGIAIKRREATPGSFDESKWAQVVAYLRTSAFISKQDEDGITGVWTFLSPGAHSPVGLSEQEFVRLGRSLALTMMYFLIKRYRAAS